MDRIDLMKNKLGLKELQSLKIGIIDSGIDGEFLDNHKGIKIAGKKAYSINFEKKEMVISDNITAINPHGSAVLDIIYQFAPNADYYLAKILDKDNNGNRLAFFHALDWMINEIKPDIINISAGMSANENYKEKIYDLTKTARNNGIQIVCAASAVETYPALMDTVITVSDVGFFCSSDLTAETRNKVDYVVREPYRGLYFHNSRKDVFYGTSFAAPFISGLLTMENGLNILDKFGAELGIFKPMLRLL